jgi:hypothetical protein
MFRILSTLFLSLLRAWTFRGCFGFDAEKPGTESRLSRAPRSLGLQTRKSEKLAVSIPRVNSQGKYMVGDIRVN